MINHRAILLFVILPLLLPCCGLQAQNLLTDPGFEGVPSYTSYGDGIYDISAWRYFSVNGAGGSLQAVTPGREGSIALRLARSSASGDSGIDRAPNYVPVLPNHRYRAVVWAKSESNSRLLLVLAPHDSTRTWLGTQRQAAFQVGSTYRRFVMEYDAPANTAYLNFAIRVDGTGSITVDSCELTDLSIVPPETPTITYPVNETVDSFKPTIAFSGSPHSAYQAIITSGETTVWDSGAVTSTAFTCSPTVALQPDSTYQAKVRVQNAVGWSDYSPASTFTTPYLPIVKFTTLAEGDVVRGPTIVVRWRAEAATGITAQSISLDGGSPVTLTTSRRSRYFFSVTEGLHTVTLWVTSAQGTTTATTRFYVRLTPAPGGTIYYYDLSYSWSYDRSVLSQARMMYDVDLAVVALQGIVNRNGPRLFVKYWNEDSTWWSRLRESESWLTNKTVVTLPSGIDNLHTLFETFQGEYEGAVLWDSSVHATSNVASTVAGADTLIPIRYDPTPGTVYDRLVANGPRIPVQMDLNGKFTGAGNIWQTSIPSTGSTKNDAYIWARTKYLETGKSNPNLLNYCVDAYWEVTYPQGGIPGHGLLSRDFVIKNRGFVFDLSVWDDEKPVDDPTQTMGLDFSTYRSILSAAAQRASGMIHVIHCMPWPYKYTNWGNAGGTRTPVEMEWHATGLLTQYNAYSDADSYAYVDLPSASIYSQFPLPDRLTQNRRFSQTELRKLGYLTAGNAVAPLNFLNFYIGDYDSAMWTSNVACIRWDDYNRGSVPMSWAFNPNLVERIAAQFEYYNRTRTDKDTFIAGNSGAGYVNPSWLLANRSSGLPSAGDIWTKHNLKYFRQANVKLSGFMLNGNAGIIGSNVDSMYEAFSGDGVFGHISWYPQGGHMSGTMPALLMQGDLSGTSADDAAWIRGMGLRGLTNFVNFRTILVKPTYVLNTFNSVVSGDTSVPWALLDAYTYAALAKCYMGTIPDYRATYTFDTIPEKVISGQPVYVSVGVRNDGWVTWDAQGDQAVHLLIKWKQGTTTVQTQTVPISRSVPSAEGLVLDFVITPPTASGTYALSYEMCRGTTPFSTRGDYAWESTVTVYVQALPAQAKTCEDGVVVVMPSISVTAGTDQFADAFYVEDPNRVSGIKVSLDGASGITVSEADLVTITGTLSTDTTGERVLFDPVVISRFSGSYIEALGMPIRSVGGDSLNQHTLGIPGMSGLLNTGLLVSTWGRAANVDATLRRFRIGDGSREGGLLVDCGSLAPMNSISLPAEGAFVIVTGISSRAIVDGVIVPTLRPRKQSDLSVAGSQ